MVMVDDWNDGREENKVCFSSQARWGAEKLSSVPLLDEPGWWGVVMGML